MKTHVHGVALGFLALVGLAVFSAHATTSVFVDVSEGHLVTWYPSGHVLVENRRETFYWPPVAGATWYQLVINRNGDSHTSAWVADATSWTPPSDLVSGDYRWWVRSWGPETGMGGWSEANDFMVPAEPAGVTNPLEPSGALGLGERKPVFRWSASEPAASWYQIHLERNGSSYLLHWVQGTTSWAPESDLPAGHYTWRVRGWNADGMGAWSDTLVEFEIPAMHPDAIVQIGPEGQQEGHDLAFKWEKDARATWYQLWVTDSFDGAWHNQWYGKTGSGEAMVPLADHPGGASRWSVRGWGPDGMGNWSTMEFHTPELAPSQPILISPVGATDSPVTLEYESERAEWYRVYVQSVSDGMVHDFWTQDTTFDIGSLSSGMYAWWVGARNAASGRVVWSDRGDFEITSGEIPFGMVLVPGGTNSGIHPDFGSYSRTVEPFFMDRFEVTKELWDVVYAWAIARGYQFDNAGSSKEPNHPVQMVNWFDCVKWLNARSEMEGLEPVYYLDASRTQVYRRYWFSSELTVDASSQGYRLPSIAEREYAARGGVSSRRFSWADSDEIQHSRANYYSQGTVFYDTSRSHGHHPAYRHGVMPFTAPVGSFAPNGYGLYDMIGNVAEWCGEPTGSSLSAISGGSWNTGPAGCRIGDRDFYFQVIARNHVGFRSVRNAHR